MADKITEIGKIPYNSPGVYFTEHDLTTLTNQIGEYRGAQIGLMERGPAFEIMISNTFAQRAYKFGDLNPNFPTSYYARQYLEQAEGLREVRILGLEGYSDTVGYAIMSGVGINITSKDDTPGTGTYDRISDVTGNTNKLLAVLKARKTNFTGLPAIYSVEIQEVVSPTTGTVAATDELFKIVVIFDPTVSRPDMEIVCSLREDSKDYIVKKLGNNPLALNKVGADIAPLWVDYIDATAPELQYDYYQNRFRSRTYYQGAQPTQSIQLITGNIEINTAAPIDTFELLDIQLNSTEVIVTVKGNVTTSLTNGSGVMLNGVKGLTNNYIEVINGQQYVAGDVLFGGTNTTFKLYDVETNVPITSEDFGSIANFAPLAKIKNITVPAEHTILDIVFGSADTYVLVKGDVSSAYTTGDIVQFQNLLGTGLTALTNPVNALEADTITYNASEGTTKIYLTDGTSNIVISGAEYIVNLPEANTFILPTWEKEVLDFADQQYLTPATPWFVSEIDNNGDYKRLFRIWSISDGKSANSEIKIDISDINPNGNNGNGSFNLTIRTYNNRDDADRVRLETYSNLTLDKNSDNYILRRIGDGEDYQLRSQFVFVEMNTDEEIENDLLPFGCLGYPNVAGNKMNDIPWTVDYDKTKTISRQTLGMANNSINMKKKTSIDLLSFKPSRQIGRGFHLNPPSKSTGKSLTLDQFGNVTSPDFDATLLNNTFVFASSMIYADINGKIVNQRERVNRNKFTVGFYGGFDGWNVYNERTWDNPNSKDYEALSRATDLFNDNEILETDFTVMVAPDLNIRDYANACNLISEMIKRRGDAVYIPDFAYDVNADSLEVANILDASNFKDSHISIYHPWNQISDPVNKVNPWVPASILAWGTIANLGNQGIVWDPAGGPLKTVTNNLIRTRRRLNLADREQLFTQNINPISKFGSGDYEIVGVRTTQPYFSALSFLHNRLLLCYARKALSQTLRALLFSMSNEEATDQFIIRVTPIFERIKRLNGLSTFEVVTRNDLAMNDKTTLYGAVIITPLYPVERIIVDFVLQDGAISFEQ